ncbi:bactofilin family protein [Patiriisocius hiemis]|uniref:Polymer-forming cytoskeletal protein n=1 Tax=Patiriisocius hiemis TaxID=3075604 RepID=A0ABU2YBH1_9FLAO|nr:polymer-forming cytoskeletal protein [Constantimarinum sp. W242]MDT0555548.1 polymer-forming cytoskeletal protein [Constantimarinum sp. W242]
MFSDKKEKKTMEPSASQNRINEGTLIKGDITSQGFFRIDGTIEGNVKTPSKVVIGKSGKIVGTLSCKDADIEGTFNGELDISGTLSLKATATIEGDVVVGKLSVEPGASFNASCIMKGSEKKTTASQDKAHPYDRSQRLKQTGKTTSDQSN